MIRSLYNLSRKYIDKKFFVLGTTASTTWLFLRLFFLDVKVEGFVSLEEEQTEKLFVNVPVLKLNDICLDENAIVVAEDGVTIDRIQNQSGALILHYSELLDHEPNYNLFDKPICYILGDTFSEIQKKLVNHKVTVRNITVERQDNTKVSDYLAQVFSKENENKNFSIIIPNRTNDNYELIDTLLQFGCEVYTDLILPANDCANSTFLLCLSLAVKNDKEIYACLYDHRYDDIIYNFCSMYCFNIVKTAYIKTKYENDFYLYDICEKNIENITLIVFEPVKRKRWKILEALFSIGFKLSNHSIACIQECTESKEWFTGQSFFVHDTLTEATMKYHSEKLTGWKQLSTSGSDKLTIMVLGGSTSSYKVYSVESWSEKLFNKMVEQGIELSMYIGARPGEGVVHECLRMMRDIYQINPDIIISMSGVNDIATWKIGQGFNLDGQYKKSMLDSSKLYCTGLSSDEKLFDFWLRIQKLMKLIAEMHSATLFSFLQPINIFMETMTFDERIQFFKNDYYEGAKEFYNLSSSQDFYINLFDLFHHKKEMFIDFCHYSDSANEILATIVYEIILSHIRQRGDFKFIS